MPPVSWQALPGLSPRCGALAWWREPQPLPARPPSLHPLPLHDSLGLIAPALTASTCRLPILHQQPSPLSPAAPPSLPLRVPGVNLRRCLPVLLPPGPLSSSATAPLAPDIRQRICPSAFVPRLRERASLPKQPTARRSPGSHPPRHPLRPSPSPAASTFLAFLSYVLVIPL